MITIDISIKILICSLILNLLFVYSWKYIDKKLNLNKNFTFNIQNTHVGSIPRLGGIAILISLLFGTILIDANYEKNFLLYLILFSLPFILLTLIDDFFQNIRPLIRLGLMVICSFAYIYYNIDNYPKIEFLSLEFLLNNPKINLIIFSLGMCTYMNGVNFIDGANGLSILTILSTLLSLLFLTIFFNMHKQINLIIFLIAAILPFFFINYPFGKIFLGDHGAYFIGWFTAIITIEVMAQNSQILNWCAIVILSYPLLEVLFSFFRKISEIKIHFIQINIIYI